MEVFRIDCNFESPPGQQDGGCSPSGCRPRWLGAGPVRLFPPATRPLTPDPDCMTQVHDNAVAIRFPDLAQQFQRLSNGHNRNAINVPKRKHVLLVSRDVQVDITNDGGGPYRIVPWGPESEGASGSSRRMTVRGPSRRQDRTPEVVSALCFDRSRPSTAMRGRRSGSRVARRSVRRHRKSC